MTLLVVLTQAAESGDSLARQVSAAGLPVERWPLVRLTPVAAEVIRPVLQRLSAYDWVFLPSPSAVRLVAQRMNELHIDWPSGTRAGLIGPASVDAFRECFGPGPLVDTPATPPHDTRHLVEMIADAQAPAGAGSLRAPAKALVLNRPDGRVEWLEALRRKAGSVEVVPAYTAQALTEPPPQELTCRLQRLHRAGGRVMWVVGANSQLDTLLQALPEALRQWAKRQPVLVPHAAILARAQALGFGSGVLYNDRRDLVDRLQYLGNGAARAPEDAAQSDDVKQEISDLSLDQQKPSAVPGAAAGDDSPRGASPAVAATSSQPDSSGGPVIAVSLPSGPPSAAGSSAPHASGAPGAPAPSGVGSGANVAAKPAANSAPAPGSPPPSGLPPAASSPPANSPPSGSPPPSSPPPASRPPPRMSEPPPPPPVPAAVAARRSNGLWALPVLLLVCLLAVGGWWYMQQRFLESERDGARRIQEADARAAKLEEQIKTLRDAQNQLLSRSSTLETRIAESATQQEHLASLYDEIVKTRGDNTLAEVEQSVLMANQHLELTGNVQAALLALQNAERRLGDSDQSQAIGARRLILQDIERLKSLPEVDLTRSAARLDEIINRIDRLPLLADAAEVAAPAPAVPTQPGPATGATAAADAAPSASPAAASPQATAPAAAEDGQPSTLRRIYSRVIEWGARSLAALREEFRSLVTIRRIDKPDSLLLSPEQKLAARENLKLQLLNARLNLLNRNEELFRRDIGRSIEAMQRLFDTEQQDVTTTLATLQSLQAQPLALNLPSLAETVTAVRAARAASEKRS